MQTFVTEDILKLQVQDAPSGLVNHINNPSGELGAWWWITTQTNTLLTSSGTALTLEAMTSLDYVTADSGVIPVTPGHYIRFGFTVTSLTAAHRFQVTYLWLDADGNLVGSSGLDAAVSSTGTYVATAAEVFDDPLMAFCRIRVTLSKNTPAPADTGATVTWEEAFAYTAATSAELSSVSYSEPISWVDVLGDAVALKTTQEALSAGTLSATIRSDLLDPAVSDTLRPGRACRVAYFDGSTWQPILTGTIADDPVTYEFGAEVPEGRSARIELTAVDALATLAGTKVPQGVATIPELPYVLEAAEVPWNINGSGDQVWAGGVNVRAVNDNASALDQVAMTRDTVAAYAWVDRHGVLNAWDADEISATAYTLTLDEDAYSRVVINYDVQRCINQVTVKVVSYLNEPIEATYGPFRDPASIQEWGVCPAEFTIVNPALTDPATQAADLAAGILAANATPTRRVLAVSKAMETESEAAAWAGIGLYTLVNVANADAGISEAMRVTSIEHDITPDKWLVTLGFEIDGSVAGPRTVPSASGSVTTATPVGTQVGTVSSGTFSAVETNNDVAVSFPEEYADTPVVVVSLTGSAAVNQVYPLLAFSVTTTGFTARFRRSVGTGSLTAAWHAYPAT